ncbi:MAG: hypothetical protein IKP17_05075 [Oscillospiraceae bacterium]|nr:hypothetical protein [Oscillospiraceae bacterium]MBR4692109.1 hypothetical protein [Oscillospiraceae bacterium]
MAKDVIFDSERFEKRQSVKRYAIPAAAILAVIVAVAVIALIVRGGRGKPVTGGTDTDYPYTWAAGKNGSLVLEIDRSAAPDCLWIPVGEDSRTTVETAQEEGRTRFTLVPQEAGRSVLHFALCRSGNETDRIYELSALTETTREGKALSSAVLSISGRPLQGTVTGGEGTDYPYLVFTDADGDLVVTVTDESPVPEEEEEDKEAHTDETPDEAGEAPEEEAEYVYEKPDEGWTCVSENEAVAAVLGVITRDNTAAAYLRAGAGTGTTLVRMSDSVSGTEIVLELTSDGSSLLLLDHSLRMGNADG